MQAHALISLLYGLAAFSALFALFSLFKLIIVKIFHIRRR